MNTNEPVVAQDAPAPVESAAAAPTADAPADSAAQHTGSTAVRDAIAAAKERVAAGQNLVPEEKPSAEGQAKADPEPDPDAKEEVGTGEGAVPEGAAEAGQAGAENTDDLVTVALPPREKDGDPVEVQVPKELAEDFLRLRKGYIRGEQWRAEQDSLRSERAAVRADKDELALIDEQLRSDPAGFILGTVTDPSIRRAILLDLMADDATWEDEALQEQLRDWESDEQARRLHRATSERDRLQSATVRERRAQLQKEAREGVTVTAQTIVAMMPEDWSPEEQTEFYTVALERVKAVAEREGRTRFSADEIVAAVGAKLLKGYGLDPDAARKVAPGSGRPPAAPPAGKKGSARVGARTQTPTEEQAQATGKKFQQESARRKAAATYAPAGAGAPAAAVELPKGQSIKERIAFVRARGIAAMSGTPGSV
jgi:hypothetical protein